MFFKTYYFQSMVNVEIFIYKRLQIKILHIKNIETKNKDVISNELPKSIRRVIWFYFKNMFTSDEIHQMKTGLIDSLNCSEVVSQKKNMFVNQNFIAFFFNI